MEEGSSGIESAVTRLFEQSRHKCSTNELGKKKPMRNNVKEELRGFGDCLGICHGGDGELKDNWDLGLSDRESDGQFQVWNWY